MQDVVMSCCQVINGCGIKASNNKTVQVVDSLSPAVSNIFIYNKVYPVTASARTPDNTKHLYKSVRISSVGKP